MYMYIYILYIYVHNTSLYIINVPKEGTAGNDKVKVP